MRFLWIAVAVVSLVGATAETQELPKSGKYTGNTPPIWREVDRLTNLKKAMYSFSARHTGYSSMMLPMVSSTKPR
jgi:hypothetical protein